MTVSVAGHRRRSGNAFFGPSGQKRSTASLGTRVGVTLLPATLALAHLGFGANQPAAALWLTLILGVTLTVCLVGPWRGALYDVGPLAPLAFLFACVVGAAVWTLTAVAPGGAHPLWAWAGSQPGATTIDRSATLLEIVKLFGLASAFLVGAFHGARRDRGQAAVEVIVWTGGVYAVISLLAFVSGLQVAQGGRLSGGFMSFNNGATVFGMLTVLGLAVFFREWRRKSGLGLSARLAAVSIPLTCVALTAACLVLTASRMGGAATLIGVVLLLAWELSGAKGNRLATGAACLMLAALALWFVFGGNALVLTRVGNVESDLTVRAEIFTAHWDAFLGSPLLGYGLGSFDAVNLQVMVADNADALWIIRATHNVYLQWLEEAGLVGALPMFATILFILVVSFARALGKRARTVQHGLVCANVVVLAHGFTDYALQTPSIAAFWAFLLGLQFAFGQERG